MMYETKKEVKKRFSTMHSIKIIPSWLFPHAKCKKTFFHSHLQMYFLKKNKKNPCKPRFLKMF